MTLLILAGVLAAFIQKAGLDLYSVSKGKEAPSHEKWKIKQEHRRQRGEQPRPEKPSGRRPLREYLSSVWADALETQATKSHHKHLDRLAWIEEERPRRSAEWLEKKRAKAERRRQRREDFFAGRGLIIDFGGAADPFGPTLTDPSPEGTGEGTQRPTEQDKQRDHERWLTDQELRDREAQRAHERWMASQTGTQERELPQNGEQSRTYRWGYAPPHNAAGDERRFFDEDRVPLNHQSGGTCRWSPTGQHEFETLETTGGTKWGCPWCGSNFGGSRLVNRLGAVIKNWPHSGSGSGSGRSHRSSSTRRDGDRPGPGAPTPDSSTTENDDEPETIKATAERIPDPEPETPENPALDTPPLAIEAPATGADGQPIEDAVLVDDEDGPEAAGNDASTPVAEEKLATVTPLHRNTATGGNAMALEGGYNGVASSLEEMASELDKFTGFVDEQSGAMEADDWDADLVAELRSATDEITALQEKFNAVASSLKEKGDATRDVYQAHNAGTKESVLAE